MENSSRKTIMVVDDNPVTRATIETLLEDRYNILNAENGADCLMQVEAFQPDLILLDIEMPALNGYQTCLKLREFSTTPVIFVSSKDSVEERLHALEVGGDDFVAKPFDGEILSLKVDRVLAPHLKVEALSVEKDAMQSMALDLLRITNEDRNLMGYVLENLDCQHHENLADSFIMTVTKNGLDCQLEIRHADGVAVTQRATHGTISPLEASLFSNRPEQSGVFVFKRRLLINRHDVSVLITNFPENSDTAERLKANLVILVEATEHLINTVSMRRTATLTTESLQVAALNAHETTRNLQENYHQQQADTQILLYGLIEKVEKSYFSMGLTEGQEARISHILRHEAEEVLDLFRHGAEKLDLKFSEIMSVLSPPKKDTGDVWL